MNLYNPYRIIMIGGSSRPNNLVVGVPAPDWNMVNRLEVMGFPHTVSTVAATGATTLEVAIERAIDLNIEYQAREAERQAAEAERRAVEEAAEAERQAAEVRRQLAEAERQAQVIEARRRAASAAEARIRALSENQ